MMVRQERRERTEQNGMLNTTKENGFYQKTRGQSPVRATFPRRTNFLTSFTDRGASFSSVPTQSLSPPAGELNMAIKNKPHKTPIKIRKNRPTKHQSLLLLLMGQEIHFWLCMKNKEGKSRRTPLSGGSGGRGPTARLLFPVSPGQTDDRAHGLPQGKFHSRA